MDFQWRIVVFLILLSTLISFGFEIDDPDNLAYKNHSCKRSCRADDEPKICKYTFVVERYATMSKACYDCPKNFTDCFRPHCIPVDGVSKVMYSINRQFPGPTIEVCENDIIEVDVRNGMLSESTTMHWHGMRQRQTPYMDGVPFISQCPILPGQNFIYKFTAATTGTYFYHSHIGFQASDGVIGALIVHKTSEIVENEKLNIYGEHIVMINDWSYESAAHKNVIMHHDRVTVGDASTILINGLGRRKISGNDTKEQEYTPTTEFVIKKGKTYRFRVILGGFDDCPIRMSIDEHVMHVISLDGNDIEPVTVDAITLFSGERVDFLLSADQWPSTYFMRFVGYFQCQNHGQQVAFLRYANVVELELEDPGDPYSPERNNTPIMLNPIDVGIESASSRNVIFSRLLSLKPNDPSLVRLEPDHRFYIGFDFYEIDNLDFQHPLYYGFKSTESNNRSMSSVQLNHISMQMPKIPLMSQWTSINDNSFCNEDTFSRKKMDCTARHCRCTHVLKVALNAVVELVLVDRGATFPVDHPFHLHGYSFRVVAEENLNSTVTVDRVKQLDREGKIRRNLDSPPLKDTIKVSSGGYTIVRFFADNPGYWFFHCHIEQHSHAGMSLIFKVGEHEDFPTIPTDFPKC